MNSKEEIAQDNIRRFQKAIAKSLAQDMPEDLACKAVGLEPPTLQEWVEFLLQRELAPVEVARLESFKYVTQQDQIKKVAIVGSDFGSLANAISCMVGESLGCIIIDEPQQPEQSEEIKLMLSSCYGSFPIKAISAISAGYECKFDYNRERDYPTLREA